jgi:septum formation topological specificity factor MinE
MTDKISFIETNEFNEKLQIILRQTDYTEEIAKLKLKDFNNDHLDVIRNYFGITEKKAPTIVSVNQEIYKQLRNQHNTNMKEYYARVEKGEAKKVF